MSELNQTESPWFGEENPRRGLGHVALANQFVNDHPVGSTLSVDEFDDWGSRYAAGYVIPQGVPSKQHILWKGHLHQRFELKNNLNKAGCTTKVAIAFVIVNVGSQLLEVRTPQAAYASDSLAGKVQSLVISKQKLLTWIGQAIPSWDLDPRERDGINRLRRSIEGFARHTNLSADLLNVEFQDVATILRRHFQKLDVPIPPEFNPETFELRGDSPGD